ncbi:hypothetical protein K435DRAFT_690453, partial [Dendrothele bispora CBS 962.96]
VFGVVKNRWEILDCTPKYAMEVQAPIPPGLAAVHNFILKIDSSDLQHYLGAQDPMAGVPPASHDIGQLSEGPANRTEKTRAEQQRDGIAQGMWDDYQHLLYSWPRKVTVRYIFYRI